MNVRLVRSDGTARARAYMRTQRHAGDRSEKVSASLGNPVVAVEQPARGVAQVTGLVRGTDGVDARGRLCALRAGPQRRAAHQGSRGTELGLKNPVVNGQFFSGCDVAHRHVDAIALAREVRTKIWRIAVVDEPHLVAAPDVACCGCRSSNAGSKSRSSSGAKRHTSVPSAIGAQQDRLGDD